MPPDTEPREAQAHPAARSKAGQNGQTFGGAGIIGVRLPVEKKSILVYKKKDHYNEWEFTYDPASDLPAMPGGSNPANPLGNSTNPQNPTSSSTTSTTTQTLPTTQTPPPPQY